MSQAKAETTGAACPRCGCRHAPVIYTRHKQGKTVRRKQCRNCGLRFLTTERTS